MNKHNKYKIEKGIPMPERESSRNFPFMKMEIGDSFYIEMRIKNKREFNRKRHNISTMANRVAGREFKTRKVTDGIRIWRTE